MALEDPPMRAKSIALEDPQTARRTLRWRILQCASRLVLDRAT
jgi:hypothetical protein